MRSVVIDTPGSVRVDNVADPVLSDQRGAIVQVRSAAICGSDLHFYDGDYPLMAPVSLGHEAVGTVVEVGRDVSAVAVGDEVLVSSIAGCGACAGCDTGNPATCVHGPQVFGAGALGGAQSELLAVPAADFQLLRLPEHIDTEQALLLTDNLATGWAGARRADFAPGDDVVVLGLGAVGLCAVISALELGAARVWAVDPVPGRRASAERLGATPIAPPASDFVFEATQGRGPAAVIDAVGSDQTMTDALTMVRAGGTVSVIGVHNLDPFPFPATMSLLRSITLRMTVAPVQQTWPELVPRLQDGSIDVTGIFSQTVPLGEAPAAYENVAARSGDCIKVALTM